MSQFVSARRREIGVRMALGARPAHIMSHVARQAAATTLAGIVAGLAGASLLARFMTTLVFGISPHDPWTFAMTPLMLGLVAAVAALVPAGRAARLDPVEALRDE